MASRKKAAATKKAAASAAAYPFRGVELRTRDGRMCIVNADAVASVAQLADGASALSYITFYGGADGVVVQGGAEDVLDALGLADYAAALPGNSDDA